jgi:hypothetical protein
MLALAALEPSHRYHFHGAAFDAESLAPAQCLGHLAARRFDHPPERLAGNVHLTGGLFLVHAFQVCQAYRLHLVHREDDFLQRRAGHAGRLEQPALRRPGNPPATYWS